MERFGNCILDTTMLHVAGHAEGMATTQAHERLLQEHEARCVRSEAGGVRVCVCVRARAQCPMSSGGPAIDELSYELIRVGEAAQRAEPESCVPLRRATQRARAKLVGDCQHPLPAGASQPVALDCWLVHPSL